MPAIFNVFSNFGTMCLLDNLADSAICGGPDINAHEHLLTIFVLYRVEEYFIVLQIVTPRP